MLVYWMMFAVPAFAALGANARIDIRRRWSSAGFALVVFAFGVLIAFRFQVGTDWFNYERAIDRLTYVSLVNALRDDDPGFSLLAWFSARMGWGVTLPNIVSGTLLMAGLASFARRQANPWLALTASVPYLLVVVGMGYTRQAAAIGLLLFALSRFADRAFVKAFLLLLAASLFHASVLVILPLATAAIIRKQKNLLPPLILMAGLLYFLLLRERVDALYQQYYLREEALDSSGTLVRLVMNAVPGGLFLLLRRHFVSDDTSRFLWMLFAIGSLTLLAIFAVFPSTTAIDRVGLYFIPLQLYVFGNIVQVIERDAGRNYFYNFTAIIYYAAVLFFWLNFASNARNWIPYHFLLLPNA